MNVKSIAFHPIRGGPQEGVASIWVELSKDSSPVPITLVVEMIANYKAGSLKNVVLVGDLGDEDPEIMYAFCKSIRDLGYHLRLHTDGTLYAPWFELASWITVYLTPDTPWLRFNCSEIQYTIESSRDPEPMLPSKLPTMYVSATDLKEAVGFIKRSKNPWGIFLDPRPRFSELIYSEPEPKKDDSD